MRPRDGFQNTVHDVRRHGARASIAINDWPVEGHDLVRRNPLQTKYVVDVRPHVSVRHRCLQSDRLVEVQAGSVTNQLKKITNLVMALLEW